MSESIISADHFRNEFRGQVYLVCISCCGNGGRPLLLQFLQNHEESSRFVEDRKACAMERGDHGRNPGETRRYLETDII